MIAVDANILVYAHRGDSPWDAPAAARVRELAEGSSAWATADRDFSRFPGLKTVNPLVTG